MNTLSLAQKKKLLSLAKRMKIAMNRHENYQRQGDQILENSQITVRELALPTTPASRNIVRRLSRLENMMNYTHHHLVSMAQQLARNFPAVANMSLGNIIRNTNASIRRHKQAVRSVISGRYQTLGRI